MPRLDAVALKDDAAMDLLGGGAFQFSGAKMEELAELSSEFSIVTIAVDVSLSVRAHIKQLEQMCKDIVTTASKDPNHDKILIRLLTFSDDVTEVFGFKSSNEIDVDNINLKVKGMTSLYQATEDAIRATIAFAKDLYNYEFTVNGLLIVLTDGEENQSQTSTLASVQKAMGELTSKNEEMESITSVLIGVNTKHLQSYLQDYTSDVPFTEFVDAGDFNDATIKRIGNFVSKSISSQSKAIGSGGPSLPVSF